MTNKPVLLKAITSLPPPLNSPWPFNTQLTLTLTGKTSPLPIRRYANTTNRVSYVYFQPATDLDSTGEKEGKVFNRRTDHSMVGRKEVVSETAPTSGYYMRLEAEDKTAFIYVVTTRGGAKTERPAQRLGHPTSHTPHSPSHKSTEYCIHQSLICIHPRCL